MGCSLPNHPINKKQGVTMSTKSLIRMALVAAMYVVLTVIFAPISFGVIQFRISEALVLLAFYKKDYIPALVIGVMIANLFSPNMVLDEIYGTLGTVFAVIGIHLVSRFKDKFNRRWMVLFIASLAPVVSNALFVGWELQLVGAAPFAFAALTVAAGEFAVVSIFAVLLFSRLEKNQKFIEYLVED